MGTKEYHKQKSKEHYEQNKSKWRERNAVRRADRVSYVQEIKAERGCYFCGISNPIVLDLHHLDTDTKDNSVSNLVNQIRSYERIDHEISKCVVLCANCHRMLHAGQINLGD